MKTYLQLYLVKIGLSILAVIGMLTVQTGFLLKGNSFLGLSVKHALAQEPSLIAVLNSLGYSNLEEVTDFNGVFPPGSYEIHLLAEWADFHAINTVSFYEIASCDKQDCSFKEIISGPDGGVGTLFNNQVKRRLVGVNNFGLSFLSGNNRSFTEAGRNPDGLPLTKIFRDLEDPNSFLIGFEDLRDSDFQDMVFKLNPIEGLTASSTNGPTKGLKMVVSREIDHQIVQNRNLTLKVLFENPANSPMTFVPCPMVHVHEPNDKAQKGQVLRITKNGGQMHAKDLSGDWDKDGDDDPPGVYQHARSMRFKMSQPTPITIPGQSSKILTYTAALTEFVPPLHEFSATNIRKMINNLEPLEDKPFYMNIFYEFNSDLINDPEFNFQCPHGANTWWPGIQNGGVVQDRTGKFKAHDLRLSRDTFDDFVPAYNTRSAASTIKVPFALYSAETTGAIMVDTPMSVFLEVAFDCVLVECPPTPNTDGTLGPPTLQWSTSPLPGEVVVVEELEQVGLLNLNLPSNLPEGTVVFFRVIMKEANSGNILSEEIIRLAQDTEAPIITHIGVTKVKKNGSSLLVDVTAQDQAASINFVELLASIDRGQSFQSFPMSWQDGDFLNPTNFFTNIEPVQDQETIFKIKVVDEAENIVESAILSFADLSLTKVANTPLVNAGQNVTYTLNVTNHGPSNAANVILTDTLPTTLTLISAISQQGDCTQANHVIICDLKGLDVGASTEVTIVVNTSFAGELFNQATVNSAATDPSLEDNKADTQTTIIPPIIYLSFTSSGKIADISFQDNDILAYNTVSREWEMVFDGSDVGITADLDGFTWTKNGSLLLTFQENIDIPDLGEVDDSDIVRFIPNSLGNQTSGSFELYLKGSEVELTTEGEDIDAIGFTPDDRLVISTKGDVRTSSVTGSDEDLLVLNDINPGLNTSSSWELYFDGSDLDPSQLKEDIWGVWIDMSSNSLLYGTNGTRIFACAPISLSDETHCNLVLYWDGSVHGIHNQVDGIYVGSILDNSSSNSSSNEEDNRTNKAHHVFLPIVAR